MVHRLPDPGHPGEGSRPSHPGRARNPRAELTQQWFQTLDAPTKPLIDFGSSGHRPLVEKLELFATVTAGTVLAQMGPAR